VGAVEIFLQPGNPPIAHGSANNELIELAGEQAAPAIIGDAAPEPSFGDEATSKMVGRVMKPTSALRADAAICYRSPGSGVRGLCFNPVDVEVALGEQPGAVTFDERVVIAKVREHHLALAALSE
jgi:hypothetical protein